VPVEYYAQRLLNPFRGTVHTIKYSSAEAVTLDGVHWDIYVANEALLRRLDHGRRAQVSDIRYGSWSVDKGLKRGPIYPSDDFRRLEEMGSIVYQHLTRIHDRVPFPLKDAYELWLLDPKQRPLALLATALNDTDLATDTSIAWRAGYTASEQFQSSVFNELGEMTGARNPADYLTRYINRRAGDQPVAQWFRREPAGDGVGLTGMGLSTDWAGRRLEAAEFPPFGLSAAGHDELHARLLTDFQAWQAPWLLMLPDLTPDLRHELETRACRQALHVSRLYRLYPEVSDPDLIKAALVEAILRQSQATPAPESSAQGLATFYLELKDNPGPAD